MLWLSTFIQILWFVNWSLKLLSEKNSNFIILYSKALKVAWDGCSINWISVRTKGGFWPFYSSNEAFNVGIGENKETNHDNKKS